MKSEFMMSIMLAGFFAFLVFCVFVIITFFFFFA